MSSCSWPTSSLGEAVNHRRIVHPGMADVAFNCAITEIGDQIFLAYREFEQRSRIVVCQVNVSLECVLKKRLTSVDLPYCGESTGCEDPRLFEHDDALWVSFSVVNPATHPPGIYLALARFDRNFAVVRTGIFPSLQPIEKNWQFFSHHRKLFAVHTICPHRILEIDDTKFDARFRFQSAWMSPWPAGEMRGGTPPIRRGEKFESFFHSSHISPTGQIRYVVGMYAFRAAPPFEVQEISTVLFEPSPENLDPKAVVFPCGAIVRGESWWLSYGLDDRYLCLARFPDVALGTFRKSVGEWKPASQQQKRAISVLCSGKWEFFKTKHCGSPQLQFSGDGGVDTLAGNLWGQWRVVDKAQPPTIDLIEHGNAVARLELVGDRWLGRLTGGRIVALLPRRNSHPKAETFWHAALRSRISKLR